MIGKTNSKTKSDSSSEFVNVLLFTNQLEHSDLIGAIFNMNYGTYNLNYTWNGSEITFSVPAHVSYTIEFPEVEGYKKPDNITFVAVEGNSRTVEAEYKAELVKVNVTSSNGSAVSGAKITINGKQQTWNGTEIRQLVPFGTQYSVVAGAVSGFGTPSVQTFTAQKTEREVSVVYIASSLKVNILSNQGADAAIANVKATVKYGSTSVQVANGGTVNLPTNVSVTISFPEVADYKKPADITYTHTGGLVEKSGTYQCELLTVNVSADSGYVSGFEVTISKQETVGVATKYTRLEYIESTGTQYIDTGFVPNQDTRVVLDFSATKTGSRNDMLGSRKTTTSNAYTFSIGSNGFWRFGYNTSSPETSVTADQNRHIADVDKNVLKLDDNVIHTSTKSSFNGYASIYIGAIHASDTASYKGHAKFYSCQVYDNGTLVRDYIPSLRSDGIAGLYDAVNDVFYASSGTNNFVCGSIEPTIVARQSSVTGTYKIPHNNSYTVSASSVSGYTTPKSVTRIASTVSHVAEQKYELIKVKDLSLFDVYGNPINRSTANCYVVREVGQYKFPLVYGNAIKNGKVNTAAFTNNGSTYSHDFVTVEDFKIESPYITEHFYIEHVHVINEDEDGVISNCTLTKESDLDFVQFNIDAIPTTGANIIISVTEDRYIWSWHIWIWPHDLTPVEITNATGVKYNIMPVNLASKYDDDMVHIKNWFYQWGRPNPMLLPSAWNSTTDHTPGSITKYSKASSLSSSFDEPTWFFYNSRSPYNWFGTKSYYNLWDAACTGTGNSDNDTVKTVYDPCPVGWKVPNGNTFTGLAKISAANGIVKMRRYSGDTVGVDFPLSGCRGYSDGSLGGVGSYGYVWLSSSNSQDYPYMMFFDSTRLEYQTSMSRRAYGSSVRPVQDDLTKIDTI